MGRLQEELHPLQNPLILEMIFKNTSFNNLKAYRQVCKQWYISSMKFWTSTSKVSISGTSQMNGISKYSKQIKDKHLRNPFSSYFRFENLEKNNPTFWKSFGSSIKTLELINCKFPSVDSFRRVIFKCCPNMEHLTLENISLKNPEIEPVAEPKKWEEPKFGENTNLKSLKLFRDENLCISWMELLSHFPALESLTTNKRLGKPQEIYKTIHLIRQYDSQKLKLKHISGPPVVFCREMRPECLDVLLDPGLSLETISVTVYGTPGTQSFLEMLALHAATLRKLTIKGCAYSEGRPVRFGTPVFPRKPLEKLEFLALKHRAIPSFAFLKFTPNVRKLVIKSEVAKCIAGTQPIDMVGFALPSCKELEIYERDLPKPSLLRLMNWFASVEMLKINGLDNPRFSLVCEHWSNLVSLDVTRSRITDLGISEANDAPYKSKRSKKSAPPPANVANLKYLKSLSLDTKDMPCSDYMKKEDVEVTLGHSATVDAMEKLDYLRHLQIKNYNLFDAPLWNNLLAKYPWQQ